MMSPKEIKVMTDLNAYNVLSFDELLAQYRLLAGRANKRLERLEKSSMQKGSAYQAAMRSTAIMSKGKGSGKRFSTSRPANLRELRMRTNMVKDFLSDVTSTPAGVKSVESKVGATFQEKFGFNWNPERMKIVFDTGLWDKLNKRFGSDTAAQVVGSITHSTGDMKAIFKDLEEKGVYLTGKEKQSLSATLGNYKRSHKIDKLFLDPDED